MFTEYFPRLSAGVFENRGSLKDEGAIVRASHYVRQTLCGLRGHDDLLHFEDSRMSLECATCGHQSPGWAIGTKPAGTRSPQSRCAAEISGRITATMKS